MKLPEGARLIIDRLAEHGFRGDIVGGCVRDHLLGKEPNDYDITTSATPEEMQEIFSDMRTIETGLKHGTLTVMHGGEPYEVTTYRLDGEYTDNRHPDSVSFTRELSEDLSRRDFTVNAMCYNPKHNVTDLFGGREDLEARLIRAVGDPEVRFTEDALRILRALRFASVLDFGIDPATSRAIYKTAHLMKNVSAERILVEWTKLLTGKGAYRIITEYFDILAGVIPHITKKYLTDEAAFLAESPTVRELSLFDSAAGYEEAMLKLRSDNKRRNHGTATLALADHPTETAVDIRLLLVAGGVEVSRDVCALRRLRGLGDPTGLFDEVLSTDPCYKISALAVRGDDISALGFRGKDIGDTLARLLHEIALGNVENDREALLALAKTLK